MRGGEEWIAGGQGVHRPSMDALLAREVKAAPPRTAGLLGAAGGWRQRRPGSKAAVRRACRHAAILARQRRRRARELWLGSVRSQGAGTNRARRSPAVPTMRPASPRSMTASARRRAVAAWPAGPAHPVVDGRGSPVRRSANAEQHRTADAKLPQPSSGRERCVTARWSLLDAVDQGLMASVSPLAPPGSSGSPAGRADGPPS